MQDVLSYKFINSWTEFLVAPRRIDFVQLDASPFPVIFKHTNCSVPISLFTTFNFLHETFCSSRILVITSFCWPSVMVRSRFLRSQCPFTVQAKKSHRDRQRQAVDFCGKCKRLTFWEAGRHKLFHIVCASSFTSEIFLETKCAATQELIHFNLSSYCYAI